MIVYLARDIPAFVIYYVNRESCSLLYDNYISSLLARSCCRRTFSAPQALLTLGKVVAREIKAIIDILGIDILGIDMLGVDIRGRHRL